MKLSDPITEFAEALEAVDWLQANKDFSPYTQEEIDELRMQPKVTIDSLPGQA